MSDDDFDDWQQKIEELKREGYPIIAPNNLPICCVMADGTMKEHEHADHRDYKFPVMCEQIGGDEEDYQWCCVDDEGKEFYRPMNENEIWGQDHEQHAFIYTDGSIVVTIYETCKAMWDLWSGTCLGGHLWEKWDKKNKKGWKLDDESLKKIREFYKNVK